jgi:two-component sensor histidine kinase
MKFWQHSIGWPHRAQESPDAKRPGLRLRNVWSLRIRLLLYVGLALLAPATLIIMQGIAGAQHVSADRRQQLLATTHEAAIPTEIILTSAHDIAIALSNIPDIRLPTAGCGADLAHVLHDLPTFANISRLDPRGRIICSAVGGGVGIDTSDLPLWRTIPSSHDFVVSGITESRTLHRPVLLGLLPLHDSSGRFEGTINISIDLRKLADALRASSLPPHSVTAVFDRDGRIISASNRRQVASIFGQAALQKGRPESAGSIDDEKHRAWAYATAALPGGGAFVGYARPLHPFFETTSTRATVDLALPFVMIALTWFTIWIVMERQSTRWVFYLRRIAAAYRRGHYNLRPVLEDAPSEFQLLGAALADMAGSIKARDSSLKEAIAQKTLFVKEIHHRVKNNLQIVMSLLSLQAGRIEDSAARDAIKQAQLRISALALVHRILHDIDDQRMVDVKNLLEQLCEQIREGFGGGRLDIRIVVESVSLDVPSEIAVPLAVLAVEALTNAFKHAFPRGRGGTVRVALEQFDEQHLRFCAEDNGVGIGPDAKNAGIGGRLIRTLGAQMGGAASIQSRPAGGTVVEVIFPNPIEAGPSRPTSSSPMVATGREAGERRQIPAQSEPSEAFP